MSVKLLKKNIGFWNLWYYIILWGIPNRRILACESEIQASIFSFFFWQKNFQFEKYKYKIRLGILKIGKSYLETSFMKTYVNNKGEA